jgi:uncharacterized protein with HEPN domain
MKRELKDYLEDILKASNNIEKFILGIDLDYFIEDDKTKFAVIYALQIIGEATNKIPKEILDKYNQINWRDIIGMRNFIAHEYFGVDFIIVWDTIQKDLPILKPVIKDILKNLES